MAERRLRPALEDHIGAGAILGHLDGTVSPEAAAAVSVYVTTRLHMPKMPRVCTSGKEIIDWGSRTISA